MYRSSTAEVMQSRTQVGEELAELERQADKLSQHAEKAIFLGRGDLAKEARARQASALGQLNPLRAQYAQLRSEELVNASSGGRSATTRLAITELVQALARDIDLLVRKEARELWLDDECLDGEIQPTTLVEGRESRGYLG